MTSTTAAAEPPAPPGSSDPVAALRELVAIARAAGADEVAREIARAEASLARGALTVAVLGQFKRGKSSLLNAFAGRDVVPTGVLPLTAVATYLVRGPEGARVTAADGTVRAIPVAEAAEAISERTNPGNRRGIRRVEISVPLPAWAEGIAFVDSPGIGSAHDANTAAARALLPQVDAAIFVLSPDPPITAEEIAFLSEASRHAAKFFFVLTKSDLLGPAERAEVEDYLADVLARRCGFGSVRLYAVSAKRAREAREGGPSEEPPGLPALWEALRRYVGEDRAASVRGVAERRVRQFAQRLTGLFDLSVAAAELSREELDHHLTTLTQGIADVRLEHEATRAWLGEAADDLGRRLPPEARDLLLREAPSIVEALDRFLAGDREGGGASAAVRRFEAEFRHLVGARVGAIRQRLVAEAAAGMERIASDFQRRLDRWLATVDAIASREFGVALPRIALAAPLAEAIRYTDRTGSLFEGMLVGQTALLLPAGIVRRRLRARLRRIVDEELDAQAGRLSDDLRDRIHRSWDGLRSRVGEELEEHIRAIEAALDRGRARRDAARSEEGAWLRSIDALRGRIAGIVAALPPAAEAEAGGIGHPPAGPGATDVRAPPLGGSGE
ncbi:MAG: dynamin family protein [Thermoplasmata archaeon]